MRKEVRGGGGGGSSPVEEVQLQFSVGGLRLESQSQGLLQCFGSGGARDQVKGLFVKGKSKKQQTSSVALTSACLGIMKMTTPSPLVRKGRDVSLFCGGGKEKFSNSFSAAELLMGKAKSG